MESYLDILLYLITCRLDVCATFSIETLRIWIFQHICCSSYCSKISGSKITTPRRYKKGSNFFFLLKSYFNACSFFSKFVVARFCFVFVAIRRKICNKHLILIGFNYLFILWKTSLYILDISNKQSYFKTYY